MSRRERWYHHAHVVFAFTSLLMALALIFAVAEALRVRGSVIRLQNQASSIQARADQSLEGLVASCARGNSLRIAITYLLNQYPDPEAIRLLKDANLDPVECLSIYPKE